MYVVGRGPKTLNILQWGDCPIQWRLVQAQIPAVLPLAKLAVAKYVSGILSKEPIGSLETRDYFSR